MPIIKDYEGNSQQVLIDAAANPSLRQFMNESDFEKVTVNYRGGLQAQVQALALRAVERVIKRILEEARQTGIDIKNWICDPSDGGFDLCLKLNTPVGQLMRH